MLGIRINICGHLIFIIFYMHNCQDVSYDLMVCAYVCLLI